MKFANARDGLASFVSNTTYKKVALQVIEWVILEHFRGLATCK